MDESDDALARTLKRMGEPSWLLLRVLDPSQPIPAIEMIRRVQVILTTADYPQKRLDPSTVHYALKRMEAAGLIQARGRQEVDVPGPRGGVRREERSVYVISGLGSRVLRSRDRLEAIGRNHVLAPGWPTSG